MLFIYVENERMSLSYSFGYHSMMSFHSSIEDEFLIDEFSLFIMKTSFSSQRRTRRTPAVHIDSTRGIVATELIYGVSMIPKRSKTEPSKTSKKAEHEIPAVNMGASSSTTPMDTTYSEEPEDTDDQ